MFGALGAAISLGSAALNYFGQESANDTNRDIAAGNNATSIELANTAFQRRVKDLKAAGLNPMLAYTQGGAQVPSLQQAKVENSAASATEAGLKSWQGQLARAQIEVAETQAALNSAQASKAVQEARSAAATAVMAEIDAEAKKFADQNSPGFATTAVNELSERNAKALYGRLRESNNYNALEYLNEFAVKEGFRNFVEAVESTEFRRALVELSNSRKSGTLLGLKIPEASAFADMWSSDYGKHVAPYMQSGRQAADIADKALSLRRGGSRGGAKLKEMKKFTFE